MAGHWRQYRQYSCTLLTAPTFFFSCLQDIARFISNIFCAPFKEKIYTREYQTDAH